MDENYYNVDIKVKRGNIKYSYHYHTPTHQYQACFFFSFLSESEGTFGGKEAHSALLGWGWTECVAELFPVMLGPAPSPPHHAPTQTYTAPTGFQKP